MRAISITCILVFHLLAIITSTAYANIIISGTRVIYPDSNRDVMVQLVNNGDDPALVQAWIDDGDIDSTPETANVPFLLFPPVVKVLGNGGQQLRIKKLPAELPNDRESVFFLNVLDIPPMPDKLNGRNTIQMAIKSRIKLFYRPQTLPNRVDDGIGKVELHIKGHNLQIINNSPFYISIVNIKTNQDKNLLKDSVMIAPFSDLLAETQFIAKNGQSYDLVYVDDIGAYQTRQFMIN